MKFYKNDEGYHMTTEANEFIMIKFTDFISTIKTGRSSAYCEDLKTGSTVITSDDFFEVAMAAFGEMKGIIERLTLMSLKEKIRH